MGESLLGSVFRVWIYLMMIIFFVATFIMIIGATQSVRYEHQATAIVERSGGPTVNAITQCNTLGKKGYHGFFTASAKDGNHNTIQPGDDTGYELHVSVPYKLIHKSISLNKYVPVQSEVRDEA